MRRREEAEAEAPLLLLTTARGPLLLSRRQGPASVAVALAEAATDWRNPQEIGERGGGD